MNRTGYEPKYFRSREIFPPEIISVFNNVNIWWLMDWRILYTADMLREKFNTRLVCNTWLWGGPSKYRGFRPVNCNVGAEFSQHRYGRALDLIPLDTTVDEIREWLLGHPFDREARYITALESTVPWLHLDCRSVLGNKSQGIFTFQP